MMLTFLLTTLLSFRGDTGIIVSPLPDSLFFPEDKTRIVEFPADTTKSDLIICYVPEMPVFPGGEQALVKFISKNTKYPKDAQTRHAAGKVNITFTIQPDGQITDVHRIGPPVDASLEKEAIRVVNLMPKWKPYKPCFEESLPVQYNIPFNFVLPKRKK